MLLKWAKPSLHAKFVNGTNGQRLSEGVLFLGVLPNPLRMALPSLNPELLPELGGLEQTQKLFDALVHPDLDLDNDGKLESLSVAMGFETTLADATGLQKTH